jgi:hypothetical protein
MAYLLHPDSRAQIAQNSMNWLNMHQPYFDFWDIQRYPSDKILGLSLATNRFIEGKIFDYYTNSGITIISQRMRSVLESQTGANEHYQFLKVDIADDRLRPMGFSAVHFLSHIPCLDPIRSRTITNPEGIISYLCSYEVFIPESLSDIHWIFRPSESVTQLACSTTLGKQLFDLNFTGLRLVYYESSENSGIDT